MDLGKDFIRFLDFESHQNFGNVAYLGDGFLRRLVQYWFHYMSYSNLVETVSSKLYVIWSEERRTITNGSHTK